MHILIVVVRYKTPLEDSATMRTLREWFDTTPDLSGDFRVLVWDNSPQPLAPDPKSRWFTYQHSQHNRGVSGAYNGAMERAKALGCKWMLLLDQDTTLPLGFLQRMSNYAKDLVNTTQVATIVPFVRSGDTLVSPRRAAKTLRSTQIARTESGIIEYETFAVNSGTLLRVSALSLIGGYSELFWLDLSDQYVFHQLYKAGYLTYLAGDLELSHSIASLDYDGSMSPERYKSYLAAESVFMRSFRSAPVNWIHNIILLARSVRQYRRFENSAYARLTLKCLWQRLALSKDRGFDLWTADLNQREMPLVQG